MGLDCGSKCVKTLLFVFNLIFCLVGLTLIIGGAVVLTKFKEVVQLFGPILQTAPIIVIAAGVTIFLVAFFGCCGAYKENRCMILTFAVLLIIFLVAEVAISIAAFVMQDRVAKYTNEGLQSGMGNYLNSTTVAKAYDWLQSGFKCCGASNYTNWIDVYRSPKVPVSCCIDGTPCPSSDSYSQSVKPTDIYTSGCGDKAIAWLRSNIGIVAGLAVAVCFIELLGIIFACCLARAVQQEYEAV